MCLCLENPFVETVWAPVDPCGEAPHFLNPGGLKFLS